MFFIHNDLIKYIAEILNKDKYRLKFNWDDFRIRLKNYYDVNDNHNKDRFIICSYNIRNLGELKSIKDRYVIRIRLWINEDISKYVDILKSFKYLTHLIFGDKFNKDITPLQNLTNLTHLTFGYWFNQDISPLQNLTNLTYLKFGFCFNQDITPLKELINITHLTFEWNFYQDTSPLNDLINLTYLSFNRYFNGEI